MSDTEAGTSTGAGSAPVSVVGVGASAGGLDALSAFFDALPDEPDLAFGVIMHLAPDRESHLPELLQEHTAMPVVQVAGTTEIKPNHVYVIPPGKRLSAAGGRFELSDFAEPRGHRVPIDHLFRTLAETEGNGAAVVLSGSGSDGAVGIRAMKNGGGLVLAQSPEEAAHDGMPRSAIATGLVDMVAPTAELARTLVHALRDGVRLKRPDEERPDEERPDEERPDEERPDEERPDEERPDEETPVAGKTALRRILTLLQAKTGHAFGQYKRSTVVRRLERRMQVRRTTSLSEYLDLLRQDEDEVRALFHALLISVTSFFRDAKAWEALAEQVIPPLFEDKGPEDSVRVWTAGCATGEEAYSVAMLLAEEASHLGHLAPQLQVFATDLNEQALDYGRRGLYPSAITEDVSEERLARFFDQEGDHYRADQSLRDMILFAPHDLLKDPPFSSLDLVICRNLLIYLNRELQERVWRLFHYALRPEGYLFLGSAESAGGSTLFSETSAKHGLYERREATGELIELPSLPLTGAVGAGRLPVDQKGRDTAPADRTAHEAFDEGSSAGSAEASTALEHRRLLEAYAPPSVVVDANYELVHASRNAGRYLQQPEGLPTRKVTELVRSELQVELQAALRKAFDHGEATTAPPTRVQLNGRAERIRLIVRPSRPAGGGWGPEENVAEENAAQGHAASSDRALVLFEPVDRPDAQPEGRAPGEEDDAPAQGAPAQEAPAQGVPATEVPAAEVPAAEAPAAEAQEATSRLVRQLKEELRQTERQLQTARREHNQSKHEMQAANEELRSINEEYKSTTEELETSKEELQSTNEELQTVNQELERKVTQLREANSDLKNLMAATEGATLFLDGDLRLRRYTPRAEAIFNVQESDQGRPLGHITHELDYDHLVDDARTALDELDRIEREVQSADGSRWFLARFRPYRSVEDKIDGVVATFIDITDIKELETELRHAKIYAEEIVDTVREPLIVLDEDLRVQSANTAFYDTFKETPGTTENRRIYELGQGQWDIPKLRELLENVLPGDDSFYDFRVEHDFEHIGERVMLLNARRIDEKQLILLAIEDCTEREMAMQRLQAANKELEERAEEVRTLASRLTRAEQVERHRIAELLHDDLQQHLYGIQMKISRIRRQAEGALQQSGTDTNEAGEDGEGVLTKLIDEAEEVSQWLEDALTTTKNLTVDLSPPVLEGEGLPEALAWLRSQMEELHGLSVEIETGEEPLPPLEEDVRVLLFQSVREALFNTVKHAGVERAAVSLSEDAGDVVVRVSDEGKGFDPAEALEPDPETEPDSGGFGLRNLRERLDFVGGQVEIDSAPGEGTRVTIRMPARPESP